MAGSSRWLRTSPFHGGDHGFESRTGYHAWITHSPFKKLLDDHLYYHSILRNVPIGLKEIGEGYGISGYAGNGIQNRPRICALLSVWVRVPLSALFCINYWNFLKKVFFLLIFFVYLLWKLKLLEMNIPATISTPKVFLDPELG